MKVKAFLRHDGPLNNDRFFPIYRYLTGQGFILIYQFSSIKISISDKLCIIVEISII
jgi:hypothetical protein